MWTFSKFLVNGSPLTITVDFQDKIVEVECESLFFEPVSVRHKETLHIDEEYEEDEL